MKKLKGLLSAFLSASVLLSASARVWADDILPYAANRPAVDFTAPSEGLNVAEYSRDTIRQYIDGHPFDMHRSAEYARSPITWVPYEDAGKLSDTDLVEGRNALNVMRFIAGVGTQDVTLCPYSTYYAQCAALVNFKNGSLSHNPQYVQGIDKTTWYYAKCGAQNCNISSGFNNAAHSVVLGYLYDTNANNIGELGHRRWCLNPPMYLTGFGQAGNFGAMWATDKQLSGAVNSGICWPAQNMPLEYFPDDTAWSISMCEYVPAESVKVTLTRRSDLRTWTFSNEHSDGYFNVNNDKSVPLDGCIIFRPDDVGGYVHGDVFNVKIEGLSKAVSYNVNFFDLDGDDSVFDVPIEELPDTDLDNDSDDNSGNNTESGDGDITSEPMDSETSVPDETPADSDTAGGTSGDSENTQQVFEDENTNIRITADSEVFPKDTRFKAQPIESGCTASRYTCDLSFICGGQAVQPNGRVAVSMPIPSGFANYSVLRVYHVEGGRCSFIPSTVENGCIRFTASSFSPYIITSEELDGQTVDLSESPSEDADNGGSEDPNTTGSSDDERENSPASGGENADGGTADTPASGGENADGGTADTPASDEENADDSTTNAPENSAANSESGTANAPENSAANAESGMANAPESAADAKAPNPTTGSAKALVPAAVLTVCAAIAFFKRKK